MLLEQISEINKSILCPIISQKVVDCLWFVTLLKINSKQFTFDLCFNYTPAHKATNNFQNTLSLVVFNIFLGHEFSI